jgi:hypothetical protein
MWLLTAIEIAFVFAGIAVLTRLLWRVVVRLARRWL